jgi:hypothetical protein
MQQERIVTRFLRDGSPVPFGNEIFRFTDHAADDRE